jgi:archaellum biogenesis protein FlaJ (TadC family)
MLSVGELPPIEGVGEVIRLAVAPVFLLSGVGIMLTLFANRLARAIDRGRELERDLAAEPQGTRAQQLHQSLANLARRGRLLNIAISLATICALLVSIVIVVLFLGESFHFRISLLVDALFIAAMLSFIGAILCFLREVFIATATFRIGPHRQL